MNASAATELIRFRSAAWEQIRRSTTHLSREHIRGTVEAILFASNAPLPLRDLARHTRTKRQELTGVLEELAAEYASRGIQLVETHRGWTFLTNAKYAGPVREITGRKPVRMSRQQLETLAIIAYRQPVTRPEIDDVRGVDSGPVLRTLLERDLVRVLGKKEEPGRPLLYGTSEAFLELFGLRSLADLPTLREFTELSDESRSTYERKLGESAPSGAIQFDDEPDAPIDPTRPTERELEEQALAAAAATETAAIDDGEPAEGVFHQPNEVEFLDEAAASEAAEAGESSDLDEDEDDGLDEDDDEDEDEDDEDEDDEDEDDEDEDEDDEDEDEDEDDES